ncbi:hypothetical protein DERP_010792 [Dermatophagoides pteronyssinus]|uniref:Uncharacterized protein n=1 Tax=Dermatophagoides pteronyssinus TaxID=6956 RepID=A0ABQ8J6M6_DERPT|nr:hypothetical protein DERP_010792 [Dermatophagoides pteronyssinus]
MKFLSLLTIVTMFCLTFVYSGTDKVLDSEKVINESKNLIKKTENLRTTIAEMPYQQHKELGDQANVLRYWLLKAPIEMDNNSQKVIDESNRLIKKAELLRQLHHAISYQQYKQLGDQCNKIRNLIHLTQTAKNQLEFDGAIKELENENQSLKDYLSHFPDIPDD